MHCDNPLRSKCMGEINHENIYRSINVSLGTSNAYPHTLYLYLKNPLETYNVRYYNVDITFCAKKHFRSTRGIVSKNFEVECEYYLKHILE